MSFEVEPERLRAAGQALGDDLAAMAEAYETVDLDAGSLFRDIGSRMA